MRTYRLTPRARAGLQRILEYVEARFGAVVAEDVLAKFEAAFEQIVHTPGIGGLRTDITRDEHVRFWTVRPSLIAYRVVDDIVEVLLIERGERNWDSLLEDPL